MNKKQPHDVDYNEFQKRFRAVDRAQGWISRCTKKWNELKVKPLLLKGYYNELLLGRDTAKSRAYKAGFTSLFNSSRKSERVIAAVDEPLQTLATPQILGLNEQNEEKEKLENQHDKSDTNKNVCTEQQIKIYPAHKQNQIKEEIIKYTATIEELKETKSNTISVKTKRFLLNVGISHFIRIHATHVWTINNSYNLKCPQNMPPFV